MITLYYSRSSHDICTDGAVFDPWMMRWIRPSAMPTELEAISPLDALLVLRSTNARMRGVPVAVLGPREATPEQYAIAQSLGRRLHEAGFILLSGGMSGVMEAVCAGHFNAGGQPIAFLPGEDWREANPYVAIPLSTGIRQARNQLIARAGFALIAVGGGYGTLSEMAYGLHFGRLVLALAHAPKIEGAVICETVEEAVERVAIRYFGLDSPSGSDLPVLS